MKVNKNTLVFFILLFIFLIFGFYSWNKNQLLNNAKVDNKIANKKEVKKEINKYAKKREFNKEPLKYNDKSIPILMYHSIDKNQETELRVPVNKFFEQMNYLKENNYETLTLDELYSFFINNKAIPEKSLVITFDDGYRDNYENAYPILKKFNFRAVIFDVTSTIDKDPNCLTSNQIKELYSNGIDIQSHTLKHDELFKLSYDKQLETLKKSKQDLEKILGKDVKYLAYPYGKWNDDTIKVLKEVGYTMAFTTNSGWASKENGLFTLNRVYISGKEDLNEFKRRITNPNYNKIN